VINTNRRSFLKGTTATGVIALAAASGLLRPTMVWAANWPKNAFEAKSIESAMKALYGSSNTSPSKDLHITANLQAENGAMVPVQIQTPMKADAISIYVKENASPLVTNLKLTGAAAFYRANIKMAKTSEVQFVVKSGGKLYTTKQKIKVTAGGCGG
jgi:sulfur-oxidizing protein SoxY